jgi:AraC-like DNA-binding protein
MNACPAEPPLRRRQVRFEYPEAVKALACALARRFERRRVARALQLPLSTVYRWIAAEARVACLTTLDDAIERALAQCAAAGFPFPHALQALSSPPVSNLAPLPAFSHTADRLLRAKEFIDRYYFRPIACDQLAAHAGLSKFHFIKEFGAQFGASPHRYLQNVRIAKAARLLALASHSLEAIAAATGFNSTSAFVKAFRALRGESVAAYLRRGGTYSPFGNPGVAAERPRPLATVSCKPGWIDHSIDTSPCASIGTPARRAGA